MNTATNIRDTKMQSFKQYLLEEQQLTWQDLKRVEQWADKLFQAIGIDVSFTKHFLDRVNDPRNKKQITVAELSKLFQGVYQKYSGKIKFMKPNSEAVLKDMSTDVNTPVIFKWNPITKIIEIVAKTVMRKKNFFTKDPILAVR